MVVGVPVWLLTGVFTPVLLNGTLEALDEEVLWEAMVPAMPPAAAEAAMVPATISAMPMRRLRFGRCGGSAVKAGGYAEYPGGVYPGTPPEAVGAPDGP